MTPSQIGAITSGLLNGSEYNPLFKSGWGCYDIHNPQNVSVDTNPNDWTDPGPSWIINLYDPVNGNSTAANTANNAQILAEGMPALSKPVGANFCQNNNLSGKQFNMPSQFADPLNWPGVRGAANRIPNWLHSDMDQVAYPFVHGLYDKLVFISNQ